MKPSSFCTICTNNCAFELLGLLLSLSIYHKNEKIYIMCDSKTKTYIENSTPQSQLQITWFIELDKYDGMDRQKMEKNKTFGEFLRNKMKVIKYALQENADTVLLDTDIIITDVMNDIDNTKRVGLSPQFITQKYVDKTGYYNAGLLWCNDIDVCNTWEECIDYTNHCPEQINMIELVKKYDHFEFGENYNFQCWRMYLADEPADKIASYVTSNINGTISYKNKPIKFVHTHFHDKRFQQFNQTIIQQLMNAKMYKILAIVFRVINKKWILRIPRQPMKGWGQHNNDSYRELPILFKVKNSDVDVKYVDNTIHCWLEPNILTYDRDTLEHCNNEVLTASLVLLGNGSINVEGLKLKEHVKHVRPWTFWARRPMLLEKLLKNHGILSYDGRKMESIFIGNIENRVQNAYRNTNKKWHEVLTEYHCTVGKIKKFTHEEYLMKLRDSRFGLCLRGYGSKCHREVELMAFGTIPIVTPEVCTDSYMEPLIENVHYIFVNSPEEMKHKIENVSSDEWKIMSKNCYDWYQRNVHSDNSWSNMVNNVLQL